MKSLKKIISCVTALSLVMSFTACGDTDIEGVAVSVPEIGEESENIDTAPDAMTSESSDEEQTAAASTAATVSAAAEFTTVIFEEDEADVIARIAEKLPDTELENHAVKCLSVFDLDPLGGEEKSTAVKLFEEKYGGDIWRFFSLPETKYSDLSVYELGGEGIDLFPCDSESLPMGVIEDLFLPVDDYIDMNSDIWSGLSDAMEFYSFNGRHYGFVTDITAEAVVMYNKKTIEENGLADPYEQWQNGDWNWDTFKASLMSFVDPNEERYGLDGYWFEKALYLSAGVPAVSYSGGTLTCNIYDPAPEQAMNFGYDLYSSDLIVNKEIFDWTEQPRFMGEGKELFYICDPQAVSTDPETWTTRIAPEDLGIVPVPSPAGSPNYMGAALEGWCLCKGAANPEGAARFSECSVLANSDPDAVAIADEKLRDEAEWSNELIRINKEINEAARQNPVVELAAGVSSDAASLTTDFIDGVGLKGPFHGKNWDTTREETGFVIYLLVDEANNVLKQLSES